MSIPVQILGTPSGGGRMTPVGISSNGQLYVAPISYDLTQFLELAEDNTAYNFYVPIAGCNFVITGIRAVADKQVSSSVDAIVIIYEASSANTTVVDKTLHQEAMVQELSVTLLPINILVTEGKYINAKTTDDDIHMTIMGYYIKRIPPLLVAHT